LNVELFTSFLYKRTKLFVTDENKQPINSDRQLPAHDPKTQ